MIETFFDGSAPILVILGAIGLATLCYGVGYHNGQGIVWGKIRGYFARAGRLDVYALLKYLAMQERGED